MDNYRRLPVITDEAIDSFINIEKASIMEKVHKEPQRKWSMSISKVALLVSSLSLLLLIVLTRSNEVVQPEPGTFDQFYTHLVTYTDRLIEANDNYHQGQEADPEVYSPVAPTFLAVNFNDPFVHSPSDFYEVYNEQSNDFTKLQLQEYFNGPESLFSSLKVYLEDVKEDDIKLDEEVTLAGPDFENMKLTFSLSEDDYILIQVKEKMDIGDRIITLESIYKIGLDKNNIVLKSISYSNQDDGTPMYNYFEFHENQSALYINSLEDTFHLGYQSILTDTYFKIGYGTSLVEGFEPETGYNIEHYDSTSQVRSFISIVNNEISREHYDFFNDKGNYFSYEDSIMYPGYIKLSWSLLEADGWTHVYKQDIDDIFFREGDGIFNDDTELFTDFGKRAYINQRHAYLTVTNEYLESEITDEILSLSQYGINLYNQDINLSYIQSLQNRGIEYYISETQFEEINFFEDNIRDSLYNYLDEDIQDLITE